MWTTERSNIQEGFSLHLFFFFKKQNGRTPSEAAGRGVLAGLQRAHHVAAGAVGSGELAPSSIVLIM